MSKYKDINDKDGLSLQLFRERMEDVAGGLSGKEIAEILDMDASAWSKTLTGQGRTVSVPLLLKISKRFHCSVDYLLGISSVKDPVAELSVADVLRVIDKLYNAGVVDVAELAEGALPDNGQTFNPAFSPDRVSKGDVFSNGKIRLSPQSGKEGVPDMEIEKPYSQCAVLTYGLPFDTLLMRALVQYRKIKELVLSGVLDESVLTDWIAQQETKSALDWDYTE